MKYEENEQDRYLTLTEVSKLLNIRPNTLHNWDANETLRATHIGIKKVRHYCKSDIDKLIVESNK